MSRQNSSPEIRRSKMNFRTPGTRSKTPPPNFITPQSMKSNNAANPQQQFPFTIPRSFPLPKKSSSEISTKSVSSKSTINQELGKETLMDVKYNLYCQATLMAFHSKSVREKNEVKTTQEMENLQIRQLELDEKMSALDTNLEKIRFLKRNQRNLLEKMNSYGDIIESTDELKLDDYIRIMEENLGRVSMKNFLLPTNGLDTKTTLKCLEELNVELGQISELNKRLSSFTHLHASWLDVKLNVQEEEGLHYCCDTKLTNAEKLVYDYCFKKLMKLEFNKKLC